MKKTISLTLVLAPCMVAKSDFILGEPTNLGSTVNSGYWDTVAVLSADNRLLLFSSTRPAGSGSQDLWLTSRPTIDGP